MAVVASAADAVGAASVVVDGEAASVTVEDEAASGEGEEEEAAEGEEGEDTAMMRDHLQRSLVSLCVAIWVQERRKLMVALLSPAPAQPSVAHKFRV